MKSRAEEAISKLQECIQELENLYSLNATDAWERLKRWKVRANRIVAEKVNETEGRSFADEPVLWNNVDEDVSVDNNIRRQSAVLRSLIDDISRNPEDFFGDNPIPHIPGLPLDSTYEAAFRLLHPKIVEISKSRFLNGQFADAAEAAIKAVNARVRDYYKLVTGEEKDGVDLMRKAFTPRNPVVKLDDPGTETGFSIQQGYMDIFAGSIAAIRNPKAHHNISIDATRAVHFLYVASLEMCKLDEAKVP